MARGGDSEAWEVEVEAPVFHARLLPAPHAAAAASDRCFLVATRSQIGLHAKHVFSLL
jgi:hypothetical protein